MAKDVKITGPDIEDNSPLYIRAAVSASTFDEGKRTVDLIFGSETPVARRTWDGVVYEILDFQKKSVRMQRLNAGANFIDNHQHRYESVTKVLGVVEKAWISEKMGHATVRFAKTEEGSKAMDLVKDGILRNVSVGYNVHKYEVTKEDGKPDTYRAVDWEPMEISSVLVPADPMSQIRSNSELFFINNNKRMEENTTPAPVTPAPAPVPVTPQARANEPIPPVTMDAEKIRNEAATAERERAASIRAMGANFQLAGEFLDKLVNDGRSVDQARAAILDELQRRQAAINTAQVKGPGEVEKRRSAMEAGVMLRGMSPAKLTDEEKTTGRVYAGSSFIRLAEQCLRAIGQNTDGLTEREIIGRAITSSTSDFPVILENVLHKTLQAAYTETPDSWSKWCKIGSVSDFRAHKRMRLGWLDRLNKVNENGEYQNTPIPDAEFESINADTYGRIINISRKMLIDDDMGAFMQYPSMLGRAAARSIELDAYAMLALNSNAGPTMSDGSAFFHTSNHANLSSSGAVIGVATLEAARNAMARQKDPNNKGFLDLRPSVVLVSTEYGATARILNEAQYDPDSTKFELPNKVRGLFKTVIDTPQLTGPAWYAFADPMVYAAFEVVFLNGQQSPYMEMKEAFTQDGMSWKVRHDYGMGGVDYRAGYRNPGA